MANIVLDAIKGKGVSTSFTLNKGDAVNLSGFDLSQAQLFVNELGQLIIVLLDGTQFMLSNFAQLVADDPNMAFITSADGESLSYSQVISKFLDNDSDVEPALGPQSTSTYTSGTDVLGSGSGAAEGQSILIDDGDSGGAQFTLTAVPNLNLGADTPAAGNNDGDDQVVFTGSSPNNNSGSVTVDEDTSVDLNITAPTDPDTPSADLAITVTGLPDAAAGVITLNGVPITVGQPLTAEQLGNLVFTPAPNYNGTTDFTYSVSDGVNVTQSTETITVSAVEDLPEFSGPSSITIEEDSGTTDLGLVLPTDADTPYGDVLTSVIDTPLANIPGTITLDGVPITQGQTFTNDELGRLQFTPNENFNGTITIDYTAKDSAGNEASNSQTINVTPVEDAPDVTTPTSSTQDEDSSDVSLGIPNPTDGDGDSMTVTIGTLPTEGVLKFADGTLVPAGTPFDSNLLNGITFTPNPNFNGTVTIDYSVTDGNTVVDGSHTVTVESVEDVPEVTTPTTSTQDEDSSDVSLGIPNPTDGDGDAMTVTIGTLPTEGTLKFADGTPVPAGTPFDSNLLNGITFTPNPNFNGTVTIDYSVSDGKATVDGSHTVTVDSVEDVPEVTTPTTSTQDEDSSDVSLGIPNPTDGDGDAMTVTIGTLPTEGVLKFADGTLVPAGTPFDSNLLNGITFTPNPNFNGTVTIDYSVSDGKGTVDGSHTVTVESVNDAPDVTTPTSSAQLEDSSDIPLNIPNPTDVDGDAMTVTIGTLPTEGVLKFADGTLVQPGVAFDSDLLNGITFTPNENFNGTVNIDYSVSDGTTTVDGSHTVNVTPVEDAPEVTTPTSSSQEEDSSNVNLGIPNPTDGDGDAMTVTIGTLPTEGVLKFADGTLVPAGTPFDSDLLNGITFTPNPNFNGTVNINYSVTDGKTTVNGSHSVTVNAVNDAPVVTNSSSTQEEDSSDVALGIPLPTDADGDALTVTIPVLPTNGVLKYANGALVQPGDVFSAADLAGLTFTPNPDFNGVIQINYVVSDGKVSVPGSHTVTVTDTPDFILRYDEIGLENGIIADLNNGTVDRQNGQIDHVDDYFGIVATDNNDIIIADDNRDTVIDLQQGNDLAYSGDKADTILGGSIGTDTVSYANSDAGVNVNLETNVNTGGHAEGDKLSNIEGLIGSNFDDVLVGDFRDNILDGGQGADKLSGGAGNDTIIYDGNDLLVDGGTGIDTLKITDAYSSNNNVIDLSQVGSGNLEVKNIEVIDMNNSFYNETVKLNVSDLLPQSSTGTITINGDLVTDFDGALTDDNVQLSDKTGDQIKNAFTGVEVVDGTTYTVLDFGSEGKMYIENGLDILDASGNQIF